MINSLLNGLFDIITTVYASFLFLQLVPLLMRVLTFWQNGPNDIDDFEDWTPFKGACVCLSLLAQCCSNTIDKITPEVRNRIKVNKIKSSFSH
jgi:hypothetical protein